MLCVVLSFLALSPHSSLLTLGGLRLLLLQNTMRWLRFMELEISFVRPHVARGVLGHAVQRLVRFIMAAFWSNVSTEFRIEISAAHIFCAPASCPPSLPLNHSSRQWRFYFRLPWVGILCTNFCLFDT